MSSETKQISRDKEIANLDFEIFKSLSEDLFDAYDKGYLTLTLAGPRISARLPDTIEETLRKKHKIDEKTFGSMAKGFFFCIHYILNKEDSKILKRLKESKHEEAAKKLEEKFDFIRKNMAKYPQLEQGFFTYTSSISNIFEELEWEVSLKYAQSSVLEEKSFLPLAIARIRITVSTTASVPEELRTKTLEFDISAKDVDNIIQSLKNLKEALTSLQTKKLV